MKGAAVGKILYLLYFSLGPVYWLPGVGPGIIQALKLSLFGLIIFRVVRGWLGAGAKIDRVLVVFFLVINASFLLSSLLHGGYFQENNSIVNYSLPMFLLCVVPLLSSAERAAISEAIRCAPYCFFAVAIFVPLGLMFPALDWHNPFYEGDYDFFIGQVYTGFGGSRTGWSVGASFLTSIALVNVLFCSGRKRVWAFFVFGVICSSIFIPGGRAGW
ncbi:hypothetical protein AWV79_05560 [Cupriavidus sp. UYMMa02A]|nr:hypothetical protein AWV79_05560 [Cupriavidus sp. UYMMa02A]